MTKVKPSDVKSGSGNVKKLFQIIMKNRRDKVLSKTQFTNDELLEIHDISKNVEQSSKHNDFMFSVIESQEGPFNDKIIKTFLPYSSEVTATKMLQRTESVSDSTKAEWAFKIFSGATFGSALNGVKGAKSLGIDVTREPIRAAFTQALILLGVVKYPEYKSTILEYYDTLSEDKLFDFYKITDKMPPRFSNVNSALSESLLDYQKTPEKILLDLFDHGAVNTQRIAEHPNGPEIARKAMFTSTGDTKYVYGPAKNFFFFPE